MEIKLKEWIEDNVITIAYVCVFALGFLLRCSFRKYISGDVELCLLPWYEIIKSNGGIKGLGVQVGNYNLLYQFFIALFTYLPVKPLYLYKIFSCIFDIGLAFLGVVFVRKIWNNGREKEFFAFSCIFLSPIVVFNSSLWAQCDSIYIFFCIATIFLLMEERYWLAMIMFGIAFSFKIQTIFILPFLVVFYIVNKKFSIKYFLGTIFSMIVLAVPGLVNGRSVLDIFFVYKGQVMDNPEFILFNYPGICNFFVHKDSPLEYIGYVKTFCIITAIVLLGVMAVWVIYNKIEMTKYNMTYLVFLLSYASVLCLPSMHERYGYLYEILAILIAVYDARTIVGCLALHLCSIITYSYYLFQIEYAVRVLTIFNCIVFISYFVYFIWRQKESIIDKK